MQSLAKNEQLSQQMVAEGLPQCNLHKQATSLLASSELVSVPMGLFVKNYHLITELNLENNRLNNLPREFFTSFVKLTQLNLTNNNLNELPEGASHCTNLEILLLGQNSLNDLPADVEASSETLRIVDISQNPFHNLPSSIYRLVKLVELHANNIILDHFTFMD